MAGARCEQVPFSPLLIEAGDLMVQSPLCRMPFAARRGYAYGRDRESGSIRTLPQVPAFGVLPFWHWQKVPLPEIVSRVAQPGYVRRPGMFPAGLRYHRCIGAVSSC